MALKAPDESARPTQLWVGLTNSPQRPALPCGVEDCCRIVRTRDPERVSALVDSASPSLICFDYDYPDDAGLATLVETKRNHPGIPIIMLTVYHSESLAVWAFRARVWDYIVKPFSAEDLVRTTQTLLRVCRNKTDRARHREVVFPLHDAAQVRPLKPAEKTILKAQSYVLRNLGENIVLGEAAKYCYVSDSHLSRLFTEVAGTTFTEFILQTRIRRAIELLQDSENPVKHVCYMVGFRDVSYFGRIFRRYVGMSPSEYRRTVIGNKCLAAQQDARLGPT